MPERPSSEFQHAPDIRPRFDLSTIMGIQVDDIEVSEEAGEEAKAYMKELIKNGTGSAELAELAYAFRRQMQEDLQQISLAEISSSPDAPVSRNETLPQTRRALFTQNTDHGFSLASYRLLLKQPEVAQTFQDELKRHEQEKKEINGTYEEFKSLEKQLETERDKLIALLAEMFKRAGQE
ncbi:hypothetical protein FJZ23_03130, partial [Candidatus Parcubacteria bacterium]|nr:hypothetical protein [Candidatus Parcubacteria bacterium]